MQGCGGNCAGLAARRRELQPKGSKLSHIVFPSLAGDRQMSDAVGGIEHPSSISIVEDYQSEDGNSVDGDASCE